MLVELKKTDVDFLYHYSSAEHLEYLEPILLKNELHFPSPKELDDPIEGRVKLAVDSVDTLIQWIINNNPNLTKQECIQAEQDEKDYYRENGIAGTLTMVADKNPKLDDESLMEFVKKNKKVSDALKQIMTLINSQ